MEKMKIGICDDEEAMVEDLRQLIEECMKEEDKKYDIQKFFSGKKLLENILNLNFNIIFLDITMPEIDGIEVGKRIHRLYPHCKIVIETAYVERFKDSFKIGAFRFITKPFDKKEIKEVLKAVWELQIGTSMMKLYQNRNSYFIMQKDIQYIMAYNGYAEFFVKGKRYRKEESLKELERSLDHRIFFRINREYIVNMFWIIESRQGIIQVADKKIKISRRRKKEFERAYMEFDINYSWLIES